MSEGVGLWAKGLWAIFQSRSLLAGDEAGGTTCGVTAPNIATVEPFEPCGAEYTERMIGFFGTLWPGTQLSGPG